MGCAGSSPANEPQNTPKIESSSTVTSAYAIPNKDSKASNLKDDSDWVPTVDTDVYNIENGGAATADDDDGDGENLVQL